MATEKELIEFAVGLAVGRRYDKCLQLLEPLLQAAPSHPVWSTLKAVCQEAKGDVEGARDTIKTAIASLEFTGSAQKESIARACLDVVDKIMPQVPTNFSVLVMRAVSKYHLGCIDESLEACEKAIREDDSNATAWLYKGYAYAAKKEWDKDFTHTTKL